MNSSVLLATCCLLYVASGGRWTIAIAAVTFFTLFKSEKRSLGVSEPPVSAPPKSTSKSSAKSPVYAVDFTTTGATAALETVSRPKRAKRSPKVIKATKPEKKTVEKPTLTASTTSLLNAQVYVFYTTLTGSSQRVANSLMSKLESAGLNRPPILKSLDDEVDDLEEYFLKTPDHKDDPSVQNIYLLVLPSYETDSPIDYFLEHLIDTYQDFRVDKYPLRKLVGFAVLGLGDSESWGEPLKFCYQAKLADRWLAKLGARRLFPVGQVCMKHQGEPKAQEWINSFGSLLADDEPFYLDQPVDDSDIEDGSDDEFGDYDQEGTDTDTLVDVEDMGDVMGKSAASGAAGAAGAAGTSIAGRRRTGGGEQLEIKEMVAKGSPTYKSLTKQGYTIVGSHSGVKICRWTKSALRGRGSCYKYAFYGIRSHLCMETTPSLACLNKCVFCWRHGTNPVAKLNWRWVLDPPEKVLQGALDGHYSKIKQLRGVPGIQMDRFQEAFTVRHCALSLVGEPIFYPHINELVAMLHERHILSFLVCNAQHPDQLAQLQKVTQLYVSIDAPTRQNLKVVDRPLNSDFWERMMSCLDILRTTQRHQRTVFRLTLVKGFNMDDISSYADLVERAQPSQIEIKGATFCGSSNGNGNPLTMQNIPFYEECKKFVESLTAELQLRGQDYEIAAEHAHSCCILMAHRRFFINGEWHTHIDYPKFFKMLESGEEFVDIDYVKPTPPWAIYGSDEGGFNPQDTRYDRKAEKQRKREEREKLQEVK